MKERPIIFNTEMVEAIIDGRKTQTRRVIKPQPKIVSDNVITCLLWKDGNCGSIQGNGQDYLKTLCPYGQVGDRLWVRETHYRWGHWAKNGFSKTGKQTWTFKAVSNTVGGLRFPDNRPPFGASDRTQEGWHKRPSIHMPYWASRITLEITGVRVERLQEITEKDASIEGCCTDWGDYPMTNKQAYQRLWDSLNDKGSPFKEHPFAWYKNPWVWVISFKVVEQ